MTSTALQTRVEPPSPAAPPAFELGRSPLRDGIRAPVRVGMGLVAAFVLIFGVWGGTAPLEGGAVAPAIISPEGSRKKVQHLEGGIIGRLLVKDGDKVAAGQPLVELEDVQPRATVDALRDQYRTLLVTRARLLAEQANRSAFDLPEELHADAEEAEVRTILAAQQQIFSTRRATHEARRGIKEQRIQQLRSQIRGYEAQIGSASSQLALLNDEITGKETLLEKQLIAKPEVMRLRRLQAETMGRRGEIQASIAGARQQISETEIELMTLDAERAEDISTQLGKTRAELADVRERLAASQDILKRTIVAAPVDGTVVNLAFKTEGGVVRAGEAIMEIVPAEDSLLIDARVSPVDIDVVTTGLPAQVRLSAYSTREVPTIAGIVRTVSADSLIDDKTKQPYYLARVEVDKAEIDHLPSKVELVPGMPAEVLIVTTERTMFEYMFEPFLVAIWRAFREV